MTVPSSQGIIYDQATGNSLFDFDTYIESSFHNANNVAFEPLENGTFSNDSKQNSPFVLSITAIKTIHSNTTTITQSVNDLKADLINLLNAATLVTIILQPMLVQSQQTNSQYYQYGDTYSSMVLVSVDFQNTPDQLEFRPTMIFQQVRLTNSQYTQLSNTANPNNSSTVNQGQVQPTTNPNNSIIRSGVLSATGG